MKRICQSKVREIVDVNTGELVTVESEKVFTQKINSENFYMVYIDQMAPLFKLTSSNARNLLDWMCKNAQFNTGIVTISAAEREDIMKEISITSNQISKCLRILKDLNLISGDKYRYQINPQVFWKGDASSRKQVLDGKTLEITYKIKD